MKKFTDWLRGFYRVKISGGAPQWLLNRLTKRHVPVWDISWSDEFTVTVSCYKGDLDTVKRMALASMCRIESAAQCGAYMRYYGLRKRWWLAALLSAAVAAALVVPRFIWFYEVEGNVTVPPEKIIRAVMDCGIGVGTYGKSIKPHLVRESVICEIPELSWLTVTQSGGRAKIVVREKALPKKIEDRRTPQNIVASHSGMIADISVLEGSAVVKKGDMVQEGQLLISGYMDLEYKYRACAANGEVYARTWRNIYAVTPEFYGRKTYTDEKKKVFYLCIGRKRIKLSLGSGIFPIGCDKMTEKVTLTLPGDLSLPISLEKECYRFYESEALEMTEQEAIELLPPLAVEQAMNAMVAGTVVKESYTMGRENGNYRMHTTLECVEMISRTREAEIFKGEFTHDGTSN